MAVALSLLGAGCADGTPPGPAGSASTPTPSTTTATPRPTPTPAPSPTPTPTPSPTPTPTPRPTPTPAPSPTPTPTPSPTPTPTPRPTPTPAPSPTNPSPTGCGIPASLLDRDLTTVSTARVIALTFDAGANDAGVTSILDTLAGTGTPATFFLTGRWVQAYPGRARTIAGRYPVGNHTVTHPDLTTLTDAEVRAEIDQARSIIATTSGQDPRPYFRFPYGAVTPRLIDLVNARCYVPFRWTVDSLGWKGTSGGMSVTAVHDRVVAAAGPGAIVLMHVGSNPDDGTTLDAAALPSVIRDLRAAGYRFVTLETALPALP